MFKVANKEIEITFSDNNNVAELRLDGEYALTLAREDGPEQCMDCHFAGVDTEESRDVNQAIAEYLIDNDW